MIAPDNERMIEALLDEETRALCRRLDEQYPPLEPELEEQWEAEARNGLTDPHQDTPEVLAWILGCIQGNRIEEHQRRRELSEPKSKITREEFLRQWCERGRYDPSRLPRDMGVMPCDCGETGCPGWAIVAIRDPVQEGYVSVRRLALTDGSRYGEDLLSYWEWTAQDGGLDGGRALSRAVELLRQETEP